MRTTARPRRYVPVRRLAIGRPLLRFDVGRDAWVLRGVGNHLGPVLREDRRREESSAPGGPEYRGPERRGSGMAPATVRTGGWALPR